MDLKARKIVYMFVSLLLAVPICIVLHEGGHALVAVLCGARITKFSILGAYMNYEGGIFTPVTFSLFHCAGMLLPVLVSLLLILTYRSGSSRMFYRIFSFFFLLLPVGSILAWVIVPVLCLSGNPPQGDDIVKFIGSSGLNPWAVSLSSLLLFGICCLGAWRKKILQNYWAAITQDS